MDFSQSALVLIDIQKESKYGVEGLESIAGNAQALIEECRAKDIPVIYTRQINRQDGIGLSYGEPLDDAGAPVFYCTGTDSIEVIDDLKPAKEDIVIDKHRWSAFYQTSLDLMLQSLGVKHLIIGGLVTDGCLMTSVFDGYFRDYQVNLVHDISATTNSGAHMSSILIMANWVYGLKIYSADNLIKHLRGESYWAWESTGPDQLQFTPETMRDVFNQVTGEDH
ncbi:cysteine hydrolase family protein [Caldalkalibacillus salinus]|uniref:cysteine hydrolase family protein n=1 Tax=Caldalkalibacillus salinus TaxID=2803787 RepID=UPI00192116E0|nr:isochorismatase family cysteine hydrolase [Caldalkalibacillus salinus]